MSLFFFLMIRLPPRSTRTDTLSPYTTLFRSAYAGVQPEDRGNPSQPIPWRSSTACRSRWMRMYIRRATSTAASGVRSEEHTSELQSLMRISYAVFCLKKKNITHQNKHDKKIEHEIET